MDGPLGQQCKIRFNLLPFLKLLNQIDSFDNYVDIIFPLFDDLPTSYFLKDRFAGIQLHYNQNS